MITEFRLTSGADHFSMVVQPQVKNLGAILLKAIDDFAARERETYP